jgi:1-deoxy-D-xylulose-5-phosphate reductoisomerase
MAHELEPLNKKDEMMSSPSAVADRKARADSGRPMRLTVLGASGSIGQSTLDLVGREPHKYEIVALTAQSSVKLLAEQAIRHKAQVAVIGDETKLAELREALAGSGVRAAAGRNALVDAASEPADCVMAAIVGAAGLEPTFAAVAQGCRIALANKECLVSAGDVFTRAVAQHGAELLPVDSEHSAAFQALGTSHFDEVEKIVLTASGGPFRTWDREAIERATPEQALKHPNWSMGAKITIDSATMMNKGLELIEAFHLFPVGADKLDVLVHPQSIVHCLVSYRDGSVLAQLAAPDMRTPIALALSWPGRMTAPTARLDLAKIATLTFEPADNVRFPSIGLARAALRRGGTAPAVLNAANEIAVAAFLAKKIPFGAIPRLVEEIIDAAEQRQLIRIPNSLTDILETDAISRRLAEERLSRYLYV